MKKLNSEFTAYLNDQVYQQNPQNLYEPVNYIFSLGGKRIRPLLLLLGNELFSENTKKALPAAYAVELFHNFSLLHDDIMDQAPLRRGEPTVHTKFGLNAGILSGDVMLVYVYDYLLKCPNALRLIKCFNKVAIEVCEGQQYDMDFENKREVSIDAYLRMIELKTAALIGGALEIGALIGGAEDFDIDNIRSFGRKVGIAFQLQDDILDTFGDPEKFGKKTGGDIAQNKKTYLILRALELADAKTRERLFELYAKTPEQEQEKIQDVRLIFDELEVRQEAEGVMERYYREAMAHLEAVKVEGIKKEQLRNLAKLLMNREE